VHLGHEVKHSILWIIGSSKIIPRCPTHRMEPRARAAGTSAAEVFALVEAFMRSCRISRSENEYKIMVNLMCPRAGELCIWRVREFCKIQLADAFRFRQDKRRFTRELSPVRRARLTT
jgi:hypothetical protein